MQCFQILTVGMESLPVKVVLIRLVDMSHNTAFPDPQIHYFSSVQLQNLHCFSEGDLFGASPEQDDDLFGKSGGLFSTSSGLFDDDNDVSFIILLCVTQETQMISCMCRKQMIFSLTVFRLNRHI